MRTLACIALLSAVTAPAMAAESPQGEPMTEPPPRMVVRSAGQVDKDRTARPPAMGQSTHAIMMPGQDMPRSGSSQSVPVARPKAPSKPPS